MKNEYFSIGTMSGTSFDGVDVALIKTNGRDFSKLLCNYFVEYTDEEKHIYSKGLRNFKSITEIIDDKHIIAIKGLIRKNKINVHDIDVLGLHGQTLLHKPEEGISWQYINAERIKNSFNIPVISDFRIKDVNLGGEGAPLVPIYHKLLVEKDINSLPLAIINIGGVSNATILKKNKNLVGFDIGPGNGPSDKLTSMFFKKYMDYDGLYAKKGKANKKISLEIINTIYKSLKSKSYDRNKLDDICVNLVRKLNGYDALATLAFTVSKMVIKCISPYNIKKIILTGGGRKNLAIKEYLKENSNLRILSAEQYGFNGDSVEAEAFAFLAVRSLLGLNYTFKETTGAIYSCSGGVLTNR